GSGLHPSHKVFRPPRAEAQSPSSDDLPARPQHGARRSLRPAPPHGMLTTGSHSIGKRRPPMKLALHSVSYAGVWPGQARLSLDDFLVRAKTLGFDAVMLMAKRPHLSLLDYSTDERARLRDRLGRLGLQIACLAGYTDFCMGADRPDIPAREMQILY